MAAYVCHGQRGLISTVVPFRRLLCHELSGDISGGQQLRQGWLERWMKRWMKLPADTRQERLSVESSRQGLSLSNRPGAAAQGL